MQKNPTEDHSFCQILYFESWRSALITLKPFLNEISGQNLWDLKKKFEKRPILSKSIWKLVKLHRQYMYGSQQLTRGATFQAVDNGADRNHHFLGFARISKFFAGT